MGNEGLGVTSECSRPIWRFPKLGIPFGGPSTENNTMLGVYIAVPRFCAIAR